MSNRLFRLHRPYCKLVLGRWLLLKFFLFPLDTLIFTQDLQGRDIGTDLRSVIYPSIAFDVISGHVILGVVYQFKLITARGLHHCFELHPIELRCVHLTQHIIDSILDFFLAVCCDVRYLLAELVSSINTVTSFDGITINIPVLVMVVLKLIVSFMTFVVLECLRFYLGFEVRKVDVIAVKLFHNGVDDIIDFLNVCALNVLRLLPSTTNIKSLACLSRLLGDVCIAVKLVVLSIA